MLLTMMCGAQTTALSSCVLGEDDGRTLADGVANLVYCRSYGDCPGQGVPEGKGGLPPCGCVAVDALSSTFFGVEVGDVREVDRVEGGRVHAVGWRPQTLGTGYSMAPRWTKEVEDEGGGDVLSLSE